MSRHITLVGEGGVEPPPSCLDRNLNPARLPIPPLARAEPRDASKRPVTGPDGRVRAGAARMGRAGSTTRDRKVTLRSQPYDAVFSPTAGRPRPSPTGRSCPTGTVPPVTARPPTGAAIFCLQDVIWPSVQLLPFDLATTVHATPLRIDVEM